MSTEIAVSPAPAHAGSSLLTDFRGAAMMISAAQMPAVFAEFDERRRLFRKWLFSKLKRGVHYGVPPGCEPRGNVDPEQWVNKPSLYKSGADFLCELMGWTPKFSNDTETWEMLGKPPCVCMVCVLVGSDGRIFGEGRGARSRGEKKMADNATIKMAEKCAKVDAVIHALSLSDLFTQDMDEDQPVRKPNPKADPNAPEQAPRTARISGTQLQQLVNKWKANNEGLQLPDWMAYVHRVTCHEFNVRNANMWTIEDFDAVTDAVRLDECGELPY